MRLTDGWIDGQTKSTLNDPFPTGGVITTSHRRETTDDTQTIDGFATT